VGRRRCRKEKGLSLKSEDEEEVGCGKVGKGETLNEREGPFQPDHEA